MMNLDELLEKAKAMSYGEIHVFMQPEVGLQGFIVIHNTQLGPSLGGCRFLPYPSSQAALIDALRLGQGMSYKAALANLNFGGGKAVLMYPAQPFDRKKLFEAFGKCVHNLCGRYITAIDSGSELADMDIVSEQTPYVTGTLREHADPSPHTSRGVLRTIEATLQFHFRNRNLKGRHIAIQGMGHVGYHLAELLHARGARLTIADINTNLVNQYAQKFDAQVVSPDDIFKVECDVYSPCALGAVLNDNTIPFIKAPIVAGGANNQLGESRHGESLRARNILYAPDFVANAGGLIFACKVYEHKHPEKADEKIDEIFETMLAIFEEAKREQCSTEVIAERIAEKRLKGGIHP